MLLTRRQKNKAYSDPTLDDRPTLVIYILRNIQKYIEICGGSTHVKDFMFGKVLLKCIDLYSKFKLSAGTWLSSMTINTIIFVLGKINLLYLLISGQLTFLFSHRRKTNPTSSYQWFIVIQCCKWLHLRRVSDNIVTLWIKLPLTGWMWPLCK